MDTVLSLLVAATQCVLLAAAAYQVTIAVRGLRPFAARRGRADASLRFLLLTCAHNESTVIAAHVQSLLSLDYPRHLYDVVVIADNCTDDTASVARARGAKVWERSDSTLRGKGYALNWAIHRRARLDAYDGVCVFDADNMVEPNFLRVMAETLSEGDQAVQAYLDTKNPWDTWITTSYAGAYWYMNRFWQWARVGLGLSGALGGTGFCLATSLLREVPWEAGSLTEDLEYTSRLLLAGRRVAWTPATRVYDEKPLAYRETVPQRTRWLRGHWTTAFTYSAGLVRRLVGRDRPWHERWVLADHLLYLWQPVIILATGANLLLSILQAVFGGAWLTFGLAGTMPPPVWAGLVALGICFPLIAYGYEDIAWKAWARFPLFLLFNLTWIPITVAGLWSRKDTTWSHTAHVRNVTIADLTDAGEPREAAL